MSGKAKTRIAEAEVSEHSNIEKESGISKKRLKVNTKPTRSAQRLPIGESIKQVV